MLEIDGVIEAFKCGESAKRVDEIKFLKLTCQLTHNFILTQYKTIPDTKFVYMELVSLKKQVLFYVSSILSQTITLHNFFMRS